MPTFYPAQTDYIARLNDMASIFNTNYLGAKASNPTVDNVGGALVTGTLYWNTTAPELRVYNGATWTSLPSGSYAALVGSLSQAFATAALHAAGIITADSVINRVHIAATNSEILGFSGSTTGFARIYGSNTSGALVLGIEGSAVGTICAGTTAYAAVVGSYANKPLHLVVNNTVKATLDGNGFLLSGQMTSNAIASNSVVNAVATYSVLATDHTIEQTTMSSVYTLPDATAYAGRELHIYNIGAVSVTSASSDVCPQGSATAGTAILAATSGKWATLKSNGTNWRIGASN